MVNVIRLKAPGGADQLESVTIELPPPQPDEVQIRQTAIGVNFVDIYQRMGLYPMSPAAIPGIEAVGLVTDVGANVTSLRAGDRIAYAGAPGRPPTRRREIYSPGARSHCRNPLPVKRRPRCLSKASRRTCY
ncbi:alcohol dehydrogenase catalytic domain-containing protein [Bradyrhizobium sp.]|uniref:alcohol dehydrogenase catalytic domain-containing protein n=1 Tax=Bradyrhizobium sp. TaxID=376 RepID=UPI003BAF7C45